MSATINSPSIRKERFGDSNTVGTVYSVAGLTVEEAGVGIVRQTRFTFSAMAFAISDTNTYGAQQIYTFPEGRICVLGAVGTITPTTTSVLASTLNTGVTVQWGIGTVTASAGTLATTMQNVIPGTGVTPVTFTASTTINVAPAAATAAFTATVLGSYDGTSTAVKLFLNMGVPTATDIDGDATLTVDGVVTVTWLLLGDY